MPEREAENVLQNAERIDNRLCVRFYRRADGIILTQDCPVGWRVLKHYLSRAATAAASLIFSISGDFLASGATASSTAATKKHDSHYLQEKVAASEFGDHNIKDNSAARCAAAKFHGELLRHKFNRRKKHFGVRSGELGGIMIWTMDAERRSLLRRKR